MATMSRAPIVQSWSPSLSFSLNASPLSPMTKFLNELKWSCPLPEPSCGLDTRREQHHDARPEPEGPPSLPLNHQWECTSEPSQKRKDRKNRKPSGCYSQLQSQITIPEEATMRSPSGEGGRPLDELFETHPLHRFTSRGFAKMRILAPGCLTKGGIIYAIPVRKEVNRLDSSSYSLR